MHVIERLVAELHKAVDQKRGCFVVLRCGSQDSLSEAYNQLSARVEFQFRAESGSSYSSAGALLDASTAATEAEGGVSIWRHLPSGRGAGAQPEFYVDLDAKSAPLAAPGALRVVALVDLGSMQALVSRAPNTWARKSSFLAWPEAPVTRKRTVAPSNAPRASRSNGPRGAAILEGLDEQLQAVTDPVEQGGLQKKRSLVLAETGRYEEARMAATKAARLFRDQGALRPLAETYELLSSIAERRGTWDAARDWMTFALETWQMIGEDERIAECHAKKGHLHYVLGDKDTAAQQFQLAIALDEAKGRSAKVAAGLRRLGLMAEEANRFKIARKLYLESKDLVDRLGDRIGLSRAHHALGRLAERAKNFDEAFEHHKQSLELKEALNDAAGMATSYHHLGNTYYGSGDLRTALEMYEQALDLEVRTQDHHGRANTLLQLALVQSDRFAWESALTYALCAYGAWRYLGTDGPQRAAQKRIDTARTMVDEAKQEAAEAEAERLLSEWRIR